MAIFRNLFNKKIVVDTRNQCDYCFKWSDEVNIFSAGCFNDGMVAHTCKSCYDKYFKDYPDSFCMEIQ